MNGGNVIVVKNRNLSLDREHLERHKYLLYVMDKKIFRVNKKNILRATIFHFEFRRVSFEIFPRKIAMQRVFEMK